MTPDKPRLLYRDMRSRAEVLLDEAVKKRILKGLEALNKKYGENWVNLCDPEELDMADGSRCVLGQVYGEYSDGLRTLVPSEQDDEYLSAGHRRQKWAEEHGFDSSRGADYEELDEGWRTVLAYD